VRGEWIGNAGHKCWGALADFLPLREPQVALPIRQKGGEVENALIFRGKLLSLSWRPISK
jgi:hypothetical protein